MMLKLVMIFFAALSLIQLIKPLGWPGLHQRKDAWKLPIVGFVVGLIVVIATAALG